jgi:hypothetical protein
LATTSPSIMENGVYSGEVYSSLTTIDSQILMMRAYAVGYPSGNGGLSRGASMQTTSSDKLKRLNKAILIHEYYTDMKDQWTGKIWEWK